MSNQIPNPKFKSQKNQVAICLLVLVYWFLFTKPSFAVSNPVEVANNKFGIHVAVPDDQDLSDSAGLVNSSGGDWGYVTVVIQENDRDKGKWQGVFDKMRKLHLIPIVRLATSPQGEVWRKPSPEDVGEWVSFLNSLNWVVKNRYLILFNEANHASEWGGTVDPEDFAKTSYHFAKTLKKSNQNYFIMLGGLDQIAPTEGNQLLSEPAFLDRMLNTVSASDWEKVLSGLSSHAYPNPGFSGSVTASGLGSIRGYEWELKYLKENGFSKDYPVFITETGWSRANLSEETVANNYRLAFDDLWLADERVVAVCPFILNYQTDPFLNFSFRKKADTEFYSQYYVLQKLPKVKGNPVQETLFSLDYLLPTELVNNSIYHFKLTAKNIGQSVWDKNYQFGLVNEEGFVAKFSADKDIEPNNQTDLYLTVKTPLKSGQYLASIALLKNGVAVSNKENWRPKIYENLTLEIDYSLLFGNQKTDADFQVELYDSEEKLILKKEASGKEGKIFVYNIHDVIIGTRYRLVLLKPGYLPRQTYVVVKSATTLAKMKFMLPLDRNQDGQFTFADLFFWIK